MKASEKKSWQLGMAYGTACGKLRKLILFAFVSNDLLKSLCFRCGQKIESVDEFSIDHKEPWLDSDDPQTSFFNLKNIAFSHTKCNTSQARHRTTDCVEGHKQRAIKLSKRLNAPAGLHWCSTGQHHASVEDFTKNKNKTAGLESECRTCRSKRRSNGRLTEQ